MAVVPMERLYLCALKKDRKPVLEQLQRLGAVEINDFLEEDSVFSRMKTDDQQASFDRNISTLSKALDIIDTYAPVKESMFSSLAGRDPLDEDAYQKLKKSRDQLMSTAYQLITWEKEVTEAASNIVKLQAQREALAPWLPLPVPLSFDGTRYTSAIIGTLPGTATQEEIGSALAACVPDLGPVDVELINQTQDMACIMVLCMKNDAAACEEGLRSLGFTRPSFQPKESAASYDHKLELQIQQAQSAKDEALKKIGDAANLRQELRYLADDFSMRREKYDVISHLLQSKNTFVLTGYVPTIKAAELCQTLEKDYSLVCQTEAVDENDDTPVLLQNNGFAQPVEGVLESYSLPGKGEVDPCGIMAIFYYFLFGLMLSDFAYGAILSIGAWFLLKKFPNMEGSLRKNVKMFGICGISTMVWGILFSSYFGDVVDVVSSTFFGTTVSIPPLWFTPLDEPMRMLVFCVVVGIIHLFAGLGVQLYQLCRQKRYYDAFCDVILWYLLVGSLIVLLLSTQMFSDIFQLGFVLPPIAATIGGVIAAAASVGIILTAGRESKSWFKRILKGAYGLYNVTGYLSDVLSYSRLLALGLATGVIASVINQMGAMVGGSIVGAIVFILVFIVGHTINLGINALGAYVHTNRLQFVEFFGKFYEGGGRPFRPFGVHTKFFKFKEDKHNG